MNPIASYQVNQKLHESSNSLVYRAHRITDNQSIILKILKQTYPPPEKIGWFKREYEILKQLNLRGVVDAYSWENYQNQWVIVLEDFGGESLAQLMQNRQFTLNECLTLGIQIVEILGQVHQRQIMHKDINPSNIVLNPTTGELKLIDFGISTVLTRENSTFRNPNVLEGTLAYVSPEQTGRMNRAIDYRTDFYSLGVTFYELLTGQLPFPTDDALELVHCHIARQPVPLYFLNEGEDSSNLNLQNCPKAVSDIVMKLMAKNAEDRYQSAYGLKADLEECLRQWQTKGQIDSFPLGTHDISDKFQIPQKLYGREQEINTLMSAFERVSQGASEMMLVSGYSGIGKSALVQEIYKPITRQRGYFISGKFDQFQRNIPYASLIQAFRSLVQQLLTEGEAEIATWREKLRRALGSNGQVLIEVIPELELVIGSQPAIPNLPPTEAQNRFNLVFQKFIKLFTQPEHPLVIFLDDLQWADGASLKLIELLMTAADSKYLCLIGAYRDNEVSPTHPLMLILDEIGKARTLVNQISLSPLALVHITQLISDIVNCEAAVASPLAELMQVKTGGNPFFITEFLKSLYAEGLVTFNYELGSWQWDLRQIQSQQLTDNVVDLMAAKVQKLPPQTQAVLQLAACVGNKFDLGRLAIVSEKSPRETATELWAAIAEGFILPLNEAYKLMELDVEGLSDQLAAEYKFSHDRIQQAVYSLIPAEDKQAVHWRVGQLLLQNTPPEKREQEIFDIVNQLNQGRQLIQQQTQRDELAELNLLAGQKAKTSAAYQPAFNYLLVGIELLTSPNNWGDTSLSFPLTGDGSWQRQYDLSLKLYLAAAETAYLCGEFEQMQRLTQEVLQRAKTLLDKVKAYEVQIVAYISQNKLLTAKDFAIEVLKLLNITFPDQPNESDMRLAMQQIEMDLAGKRIEDLIDLPEMTEPDKLAAMGILSSLFSITFKAVPQLMPLCTCKQVSLSIKYGNTAESAFAYVTYGLIICGLIEDIDSGYAFGQLALDFLERTNNQKLKATVFNIFYVAICHWKKHIKDTLKPLQEGYQSGLETGDLEFGSYCAFAHCFNLYYLGKELTGLERELALYSEAISQIKQQTTLHWHQIYWQSVLNLMGRNDNSYQLSGEVYDENKMLHLHLEANDRPALYYFFFNKMFISYFLQEYAKAVEFASKAEEYLDGTIGIIPFYQFHSYDSLSQLAVFPEVTEAEQKRILAKVAANQEKIEKWASYAPMNYLHKFYLVEAERARVLGNDGDAREYYDKAISLAQENEYLNEEALAYELAGRFYLVRNQNRLAHLYLQDAHYAYQRWGATAKVQDLERRYPQFFAATSSKSQDTPKTKQTTGSSSGEALDLATVMKASQAISGEIVLDKLLEELMKITIENAGAQKGFLILPSQTEPGNEEGHWAIAASGTVDSNSKAKPCPRASDVTTLQSIPIDSVDASSQTPLLCGAIIHYVARTKENVVLNDAVSEGQFTSDSYILTTQPKSILCTPLLNQGKLSGILYLENNLSTGAFTRDRIEILNLLSSQAAISIENATLYNNLEQKVKERTIELEQEIVDRKRAEESAQAANQAKSTFLANMSHELRSPLNAILGFSQVMLRSQTLPSEHLENAGIITRSGEHLLTLINQVLDLSKIEAGRTTLDEKNFKLYSLLDDLDDMFQLKAEEKGLQLVCDRAPDVPHYIRTDEVKLRQVLINLLNNAIKFTPEGRVSVRVSTTQIFNADAQINTDEAEANQSVYPCPNPCHAVLCFEVSDTGSGIAPDELDSLFEAFVQTQTGKESQEGTGLGLSITRKFVQLMGGDITVNSEVGRGTTFKFDITVGVVDATDIESTQPTRRVIALEPNQPRYRILIVDDKRDNRQLIIKLLNPLGFELKQASNGQEAVEIWDKWEPHLIWMDMRMPVIDGYEATKQIKSTTKGQATSIIAVTASVLEEERAVVSKAGCDDFLRKPFRESDIFELMRKHIGVRYIYDEPTAHPAHSMTNIQDTLTPEAFAAVPSQLLANLERAARYAYMTESDRYIDEIRSYNATLADALATLANEFDYSQIVNLIQDMVNR